MTKEEILYNRRCAEFLGGEYTRREELSFEPKGRWHISAFPDAEQDYDLKFHDDWNWIMKVIETIEELGYATLITHDYTISNYGCDKCVIETIENALYRDIDSTPPIASKLTRGKKEAVTQVINRFLVWYEKENKIWKGGEI